MNRFQIYLGDEHIEFAEWYGRKFDIIAKTGSKTGQPDRSAVIRLALENLMTQSRDDLADVGLLPWRDTDEPMPETAVNQP